MRFDITALWYQPKLHWLLFLLLPVSWIFNAVICLRRFLYRKKIFTTYAAPIPIIIVGNIAVGGTGKTPFVISLVKMLQDLGYCPGVVSRGFGEKKLFLPHIVTAEDTPKQVGDEAMLILKHTQCPIVVGINKVAAVKKILQTHCDIIICDDGLQHYRLERDIEIAMVDAARQFGNGKLLPAGPLRESISRLKTVDFIIETGKEFILQPEAFISVMHPNTKIVCNQFRHKTIHAVAGIGNPERFFTVLQSAGFTIIPHRFPDHYHYSKQDLDFDDNLPIVMTEKDAVKCIPFADPRFWFLGTTANIHPDLKQNILLKITNLKGCSHEKFSEVATADISSIN